MRRNDSLALACQFGQHETCAHENPVVILFSDRVRSRGLTRLCTCDCHARCPLGGVRAVPEEEWLDGCTCPGGQLSREVRRELNRELEQCEARDAEVLGGLDLGRGRTASEIQAQILGAYAAHGHEPPTDFSRLSRFLAAGTGRRGTRTIRLLAEAVRGLRAAMNWPPQAPGEPVAGPPRDRPAGSDGDGAPDELRQLYRLLTVFGSLAAAAAVGAHFTRGTVRAALIAAAVALSALAAWTGFMTMFLVILFRVLRRVSAPGREHGA